MTEQSNSNAVVAVYDIIETEDGKIMPSRGAGWFEGTIHLGPELFSGGSVEFLKNVIIFYIHAAITNDVGMRMEDVQQSLRVSHDFDRLEIQAPTIPYCIGVNYRTRFTSSLPLDPPQDEPPPQSPPHGSTASN